jgi:hypothetical protein
MLLTLEEPAGMTPDVTYVPIPLVAPISAAPLVEVR